MPIDIKTLNASLDNQTGLECNIELGLIRSICIVRYSYTYLIIIACELFGCWLTESLCQPVYFTVSTTAM